MLSDQSWHVFPGSLVAVFKDDTGARRRLG